MSVPPSNGLHDRLRAAAGDRTYRHLSEMTGVNHETVRRYMQGHPPSAEFLAAVCTALDINAQWLLIGRGPQRGTDIKRHALGEAQASDLLQAMSRMIEALMARVDRMEAYVQRLETLVRAGVQERDDSLPTANNPGPGMPKPGSTGAAHETAVAHSPPDRVSEIISALSKRSPSNAG